MYPTDQSEIAKLAERLQLGPWFKFWPYIFHLVGEITKYIFYFKIKLVAEKKKSI